MDTKTQDGRQALIVIPEHALNSEHGFHINRSMLADLGTKPGEYVVIEARVATADEVHPSEG